MNNPVCLYHILLLDFEVPAFVYLCSKQLNIQNIVREEKNSGLNGLVFHMNSSVHMKSMFTRFRFPAFLSPVYDVNMHFSVGEVLATNIYLQLWWIGIC